MTYDSNAVDRPYPAIRNFHLSAYCVRTLHELIAQEWRIESGVDEWFMKWEIALSRAYERADDACKEVSSASAGSTSLVVLLSACQIIAASCGDSRAVLVRKRDPLTSDHKDWFQDRECSVQLIWIEFLRRGKVIDWVDDTNQ